MKNLFSTIFLGLMLLLTSCNTNVNKESNESEAANPTSCIDLIIQMDDSLGTIRNHACESIPLSETIENYVQSIRKLDFEDCPEKFSKAFEQHMDAWTNMISLTDQHPDLRGEMHELFDELKVSADSVEFNQKLQVIWDTWGEVENFIK